jgi:two-component system response regulator AtoC
MSLKRILIIDDKHETREAIKEALKEAGKFKFLESEDGIDGLSKIRKEKPELTFLDVVLPRLNGVDILQEIKGTQDLGPIVIITAHPNLRLAVLAMKLGAYNFIPKPFAPEQIKAIAINALEKEDLVKEIAELRDNLVDKYHFGTITAKSGKMQQVLAAIDKVKDAELTILILGETGSGKELVAKAIHFNSPRRNRPLITINCAAIPDTLLESELFGHERGAFTGALERKIGKFELAEGSSIFLDEIGDLPLSAQAKVLRLIENKEFMRVGGTEVIKADVRIISATHQDLYNKVNDKSFREDLYYRLSTFPVVIPPLRERQDDLPFLISEFLELHSEKNNKNVSKVSNEVIELFRHYPWPGNVRELENVIARAVILAPDDTITLETLDPTSRAQFEASIEIKTRNLAYPGGHHTMDDIEKVVIEKALHDADGDVIEAAKELKISKSTLYRKINKYDIPHDF